MANFSLASFSGGVALDGATFEGGGDFTGARFMAEASFADADFTGPAVFDLASFAGSVVFSGSIEHGRFWSSSSFTRTSFEDSADFRQRSFQENATFAGATFGGPADFTLAHFSRVASFERAGFRGSATFLATDFVGETSFQFVVASRSLDFFAAQFFGPTSFFGLAAAGPVSFDRIAVDAELDMSRITVDDLTMEVEIVAQVGGVVAQEAVLRLIERSARARGDLSVANEARFHLLSLENEQSGGLKKWVDWLFYRTIAGYLVKPTYPLVAFLLLLALGMVVRTASGWRDVWSAGRENPGAHDEVAERGSVRARRTGVLRVKMAAAFFKSLADTASVAFRPKPGISLEDTERMSSYGVAAVRWVEFLSFKVLIALFLFGLANSNATLRELVDAVRG